MNILVAWDDATEADLLQMYLAVGGENEVTVCLTPSELQAQLSREHYSVAVISQGFPTVDDGFAAFQQVRARLPDVPVVLGTRPAEMIALPRFLKQGLRSYVIRDERGDYLFLILASLESTVAAVQSERMSLVAEKLREEMDGVRKLQETIIPRGIQSQEGYRAVARYEPAEMSVAGGKPVVMAGGDYYEVFPADRGNLVALVGDASGHGLKACMSIITMHTLIRMISSDRYRDTAAFVEDINRRLCENVIVQSGGGFITLFYGCIDTQAHRLYWTSAGHPLALIHDLDRNEVTPVGSNSDGGLPLGISTEIPYDGGEAHLPPRSRVLIYSDGLTDALAPPGSENTLFGVEGICAALRECADRTLEESLEHLFDRSRSFTCGEGRHDDTSVVLIERL